MCTTLSPGVGAVLCSGACKNMRFRLSKVSHILQSTCMGVSVAAALVRQRSFKLALGRSLLNSCFQLSTVALIDRHDCIVVVGRTPLG